MELTMSECKKVTQLLSTRYRSSSKKTKGLILKEFLELTGYNRHYGAYLLHNHGKRAEINNKLVIIGDVRQRCKGSGRKSKYGQKDKEALKSIWYIADCICGKRLKPIISELIDKLEFYKELKLKDKVKEHLKNMSASTIDRLLKGERKKYTLKGRKMTKPGSLLKHQIPIRTYADWNENKAGFIEIDLVGHESGNASGDFIQTLDATDVFSGWTESYAVRNKAQVYVFKGLMEIKQRLPFPLLGIDSDNGCEFINGHLMRYCFENKITFTRGRSGKKNDNCYVEQKNYSVVRRAVGYFRYDTLKELKVLNELYSYLRLYNNYFQPVMKLEYKKRIGSKIIKHYDRAKTPYMRLLESDIGENIKEKLKKEYNKLNPAYLKREITRLQKRLLYLGRIKKLRRYKAKEKTKTNTEKDIFDVFFR